MLTFWLCNVKNLGWLGKRLLLCWSLPSFILSNEDCPLQLKAAGILQLGCQIYQIIFYLLLSLHLFIQPCAFSSSPSVASVSSEPRETGINEHKRRVAHKFKPLFTFQMLIKDFFLSLSVCLWFNYCDQLASFHGQCALKKGSVVN